MTVQQSALDIGRRNREELRLRKGVFREANQVRLQGQHSHIFRTGADAGDERLSTPASTKGGRSSLP